MKLPEIMWSTMEDSSNIRFNLVYLFLLIISLAPSLQNLLCSEKIEFDFPMCSGFYLMKK